MIIKVYLIVLASLLCSVALRGQNYLLNTIEISDTSVFGLDVIEDINGDVFILGTINRYLPQMPIEGTLTFGSALFKLDEKLARKWEVFYSNSHGSQLPRNSRTPARFLLKSRDGKLQFPYTKYSGVLTCDSSTLTAEVEKLGLLEVNSISGDIISDEIIDELEICESQGIIGATFVDDDIVLVSYDRLKDQLFLFRKVKGEPFDIIDQLELNMLAVKNDLLLSQEDVVFFVSNTLQDGYILLSDYDLRTEVISTTTYADTVYRTPQKLMIADRPQSRFLIWSKYSDPTFTKSYSQLAQIDTAGLITWRKNYLINIRDIIRIPDEGYLAAWVPENSNSDSSGIAVSFIDQEGNIVVTKKYGTNNDYPVKLSLTKNQDSFLLLGNRSERGNNNNLHPSALIIIKDNLSVLTKTLNPAKRGSINLFPNPVFSQLRITTSTKEESTFDFSIFDSKGQVVSSQRKSISQGQELKLNVGFYPKGLYFIVMSDLSGSIQYTGRFLKL